MEVNKYSITIDSYREISNIIQLFIEITIINNDDSKDLSSISKFLGNSETIIDMINSVFVKENNMSYSITNNNDNSIDFDVLYLFFSQYLFNDFKYFIIFLIIYYNLILKIDYICTIKIK